MTSFERDTVTSSHLKFLLPDGQLPSAQCPPTSTFVHRRSCRVVFVPRLERYDNFRETATRRVPGKPQPGRFCSTVRPTWRLAEARSRLTRRLEQTNAEQDKSVFSNLGQSRGKGQSPSGVWVANLSRSHLLTFLPAESIGSKPRSE